MPNRESAIALCIYRWTKKGDIREHDQVFDLVLHRIVSPGDLEASGNGAEARIPKV